MAEILKRKYVNYLSILSVLIIIGLSFVSFWHVIRLSNANNSVRHTYEVMQVANNILVNMNYVENRIRGYLLTSDTSYLEMYSETLQNIYKDVSLLELLTRDHPEQAKRVSEFRQLLNTHLITQDTILKTFSSKGSTAAIELIKKNRIAHANDVQQAGLNIINYEKQLLLERTRFAIRDSYHAVILVMAGNILSLSLILFSIWLLNKQLTYRIRVEEKLRLSEEELSKLAYFDTLTKLANRTLLVKYLEKALAIAKNQGGIIAVLQIDLDNFKSINDSLGHELGDDFLIRFAERLQDIVSENQFIARIGSDAFAIIIRNVKNLEEIIKIAQSIIDGAARAIIVRNHHIFVTVSIGISIYPNNGIDTKTLLKNADISVSRAKELGKNNYQLCTPEMTLEIEKRALLDYHLHQALSRNEFVLLYQPKVSLIDGKVTGVEALIRWNRPDVGLIYPVNFISLAESNGLIVPIGEWMLRTACIQGKKWQKAGLPIQNIAINISSRQLVISDFVSSVRQILNETGFDPNHLEIEITESILMEHSSNNLAALRALEALGIQITIDDFGTGYSALSYLTLFSIDKLKLDKSFIQQIIMPDQQSIVGAIIVMAHSLGLKVVAEGVETLTQLNYLKQFNCDEVQGFYYSKPLPANEIGKFLAKVNSQ